MADDKTSETAVFKIPRAATSNLTTVLISMAATGVLGFGGHSVRNEISAALAELSRDVRDMREGQEKLSGELARIGGRLSAVESAGLDARMRSIEQVSCDRRLVALEREVETLRNKK